MEAKATLDDYKLSCELFGHSSDVRSVADGGDFLLSGSRDKTTRIWRPEGKTYIEDRILSNHKNFVSCVYYLDVEGWICTGSNDTTICIYKEGAIAPFLVLTGHESTVCALTKGINCKTLVSGSWDKTGRIWTISESGSFTYIPLKGHEAAVWAVATISSKKKYVTASADKNIYFWNENGQKLKVLKGHTDCVRGLIGLNDGSLVSCSNDGSIRHWNEDGECLRELHGHGNYIYSIALNKSLGPDIIVSGSEDNTIRMWSLASGNLGNCIMLPAQSVWSVTCLQNGDIVTGTSDGVVRIFTKDPGRIATESVLHSFNIAVQARITEANLELGGIKRTDLPGPETLLQPGRDGQTKLVRHPDGKIKCYKWENNQWTDVGEVVGASGGTQSTSGKALYEGKEYDYVFNVDISESAPPIKLPYNRGEDPWLAAQKFIHKNNLPQVYLDQVANFIIKNAANPVKGETPNARCADPFTGGSRYIPGGSSSNVGGGTLDPFTGDSSYTTAASRNNVLQENGKHFPRVTFHTFDKCDPAKILDKLREFNSKSENSFSVSEEFLQAVVKLTDMDPEVNNVAIQALQHLLSWPKEILFPVLDIARLAIRNEQIFILLNNGSNFIEYLTQHLGTHPANQLMSVRGFVNIMKHTTGRNHVGPRLGSIIEKLSIVKAGSQNLQIAIATFYLSSSSTQLEIADSEKCQCIAEGILEFLKWATDLEAYYRALQAIGNLTSTSYAAEISAQVVSVDHVMDKIRHLSKTKQPTGFEKLSECANALLSAF